MMWSVLLLGKNSLVP